MGPSTLATFIRLAALTAQAISAQPVPVHPCDTSVVTFDAAKVDWRTHAPAWRNCDPASFNRAGTDGRPAATWGGRCREFLNTFVLVRECTPASCAKAGCLPTPMVLLCKGGVPDPDRGDPWRCRPYCGGLGRFRRDGEMRMFDITSGLASWGHAEFCPTNGAPADVVLNLRIGACSGLYLAIAGSPDVVFGRFPDERDRTYVELHYELLAGFEAWPEMLSTFTSVVIFEARFWDLKALVSLETWVDDDWLRGKPRRLWDF